MKQLFNILDPTSWRFLFRLFGLSMGLLMFVGNPSLAATFESHNSIRHAAHNFLAHQASGVNKDIKIKVNELDPRLRVAACDQPLSTFFPPGSDLFTTSTVGVQCRGTKPWTLYVPAQVDIVEKVVITLRPMTRGHRVTPQDVTTIKRDVGGLHTGFFTDTNVVIGKVIKRSIPVNSVLTRNLLQKTLLVRRGDQVTIVARAAGLEVRMTGKALMNGSQGEQIQVRNATSKQVVTGTVSRDGTVDVQL